MSKNTSWEKVAGWYDKLLEGEGTYQKELILPNLSRLMNIKKGDRVLDLACGQGFFAREFAKQGASVIGVDASPSLIKLAIKNSSKEISFRVGPAHKLNFLQDASLDKVVIVLAIQNIENAADVLREAARVLKKSGSLFVVLNHPAFRIPKASEWGWDEAKGIQFRRIDAYLSESKVKISMHPGNKPSEETVSFHRPLQFYFKAFKKAGLSVSILEEWNSHKKSERGPRAKAEDMARREIPLFMCLGAFPQAEGRLP
jgi:ubiquinone/menaquinone biosynthesis C-methylase UbiE